VNSWIIDPPFYSIQPPFDAIERNFIASDS
jgi:hypothetical protein